MRQGHNHSGVRDTTIQKAGEQETGYNHSGEDQGHNLQLQNDQGQQLAKKTADQGRKFCKYKLSSLPLWQIDLKGEFAI